MIRLTFEERSTKELYRAMADFLEGAVEKTETKTAGIALTTAKAAAKTVDDSQVLPPPPTKAVIKFAKENGIDLTAVRGTGVGGRITMADVRAVPLGKPEKAKKAAKAEPADTEAGAQEDIYLEGPSAPTLDDARAALKRLSDKGGISPCMEALARFGCQRISELKEDAYADFIKLCDEQAADGK